MIYHNIENFGRSPA